MSNINEYNILRLNVLVGTSYGHASPIFVAKYKAICYNISKTYGKKPSERARYGVFWKKVLYVKK